MVMLQVAEQNEEEPLLNVDADRPVSRQTGQYIKVHRIRWLAVVALMALGFCGFRRLELNRANGALAVSRWGTLQLNQESKEKIIHVAYKPVGKCLDLQQSEATPDVLHAVLRPCDFTRILSSQMWVVDPDQGLVRNVLHSNKCLETQQFRELAFFGAENCKPFSQGQLWGLTQDGQLATLQQNKHPGLPSAYCAVPEPGNLRAEEPSLVLQACLSTKSPTHQNQWTPVDTGFGSNVLAEQRKRPGKAIAEESHRRKAAEKAGQLMTVNDLVHTIGFASVHREQFWWTLTNIFGALGPSWNRWEDVLAFKRTLANQSDEQAAIASAVVVNILSNMAFAGMNFIKGSNGKDLIFLDRKCQLPLKLYTQQPLQCDSTPSHRRPDCTFQIPNYFESLDVMTLADYASSWSVGPLFSVFKKLYTAKQAPSWEDKHGQVAVLGMAAEGLKTAKQQGFKLLDLVSDVRPGFRFAFDLEGILATLQEGFYWDSFSQMKYAASGAFGAAVIEDKADQDVLGFLMMKSQLAMHLVAEDGLLVADLSDLEAYKPLPGFAPLGGKAKFQLKDGVLKTVQLQYQGVTHSNKGPAAAEQFQQSVLEGWNFAEKAIIASLLAKTQLLVHVKTIHMELAPSLQAVTIEALKGRKEHPLRQFLEPFTTRNIQATNNNLKIWFEFGGAEFGLAPLTVEEQLKLIADNMAKVPLNLAELDMQKFAEVRGWLKLGFQPDWYQRAVQVQNLFDELIREFAQGAFEGDDANLRRDEGVVMWWKTLYEKMPALRKAAEGNWLNNRTKSAGIDYDVIAEKVAAIEGNHTRPLPDLQPYVPPMPNHPPGYWTTKATTSTTTTTTTFTGFYRPVGSLSQNPAGLLPTGSFAPAPPQKFKTFYSPVQSFPADQATSAKDTFFNLKSWLPSGRRLQAGGEQVAEVAKDLENMEVEMKNVEGPLTKALEVGPKVNELVGQFDDLQDAASNLTQVSVRGSINDLVDQMDDLQEDAGGVTVVDELDVLAAKLQKLQEKAAALDVTDTIRNVSRKVLSLQETKGAGMVAVRDNLVALVARMNELKEKAANATNVTGGIGQLTSEIGDLEEAAQGGAPTEDQGFSKELDALKEQPLTDNASQNIEILSREIDSIAALERAVISSTENLAREFDAFQEKALNAIEVSREIRSARQQLKTLKADSADALVVTDEITRLATELHSLQANASKSGEVASGIADLLDHIAKIEEAAEHSEDVSNAINKFAAKFDDVQDQTREVMEVSGAIRDFAGNVSHFEDQEASATKQANEVMKGLKSQLDELETAATSETARKAVGSLAQELGAVEKDDQQVLQVIPDSKELTSEADAEELPTGIAAVAGSVDQFAKRLDAFQDKANDALEVKKGIMLMAQKIKAMQNRTAAAMGATAGLEEVTEQLDAMQAKTKTAVKVANGVAAIVNLMKATQEQAEDTMNVSKEMIELTQKIDDLKVKTAKELNMASVFQKMRDRLDHFKNLSESDAVDGTRSFAEEVQQLKYGVEISALRALQGIKQMATEAQALQEKASIPNLVTGPESIDGLAIALQKVQDQVLSGKANVTNRLAHMAATVTALRENTSEAVDTSESLKSVQASILNLQATAESMNVTSSIKKLSGDLDMLQDQSANVSVSASLSHTDQLAATIGHLQDEAKGVTVGKDISELAHQLETLSENPPGVSIQALPMPAVPVPPTPLAPVTPAPPVVPVTPSPAVALGMVGIGTVPTDRGLDGPAPSDHSDKGPDEISQQELEKMLQKLPPLNVETLTRVLRSLFLWTSWVHEDVGHAWASFIYNPIHTPGFVPADGKGIPLPALMYRVAMFRCFVALERNKLTDPIDTKMFSTTICSDTKGPYSWSSCQNEVDGVLANAFNNFRRKLTELQEQQIFSEIAQHGFFSRVSDVESSASS